MAAAGFLCSRRVAAQGERGAQGERHPEAQEPAEAAPPSAARRGRGPLVETPDVPRLPWKLENGVKVFHLVAEPVKREFLPGRVFDVWGFNGSMPGPTVEVFQGDRVRFIVDNHLPEATSIHWHGFELPVGMDGVPGLTQDPIPPGGRFVYEFPITQAGTFFYHTHMPMQEMLGMIGLFIKHPRRPVSPPVDKDFGLIFQEWAILPNNTVPNTLSMEFNWLTINGRSGPATTPMIVRLGERVRIRMVNLGMSHHPIHLHGNTFVVTGTEAGRVPRAAWTPANTVLLGVASARDVEFVANNPGDWMLHCHLPHHMANAMVSMVGPLVQAGPGLPSGLGMEEGMGIVKQGGALGEEQEPSLGRGMGAGAEHEKATATHAGPAQRSGRRVPGFPQDMFVPMDELVAKPETHGLRPTWSGGVVGMMTLVRVLPPKQYDEIAKRRRAARTRAPAQSPSPPDGHDHHGR